MQLSFPDTEIAMSTTDPAAAAPAGLLAAASAASGALAGAIDDLHRAALILRQESRPTSQRFRTPDDLRRVADQFSDRARACQAAQDALLAAGREGAGPGSA